MGTSNRVYPNDLAPNTLDASELLLGVLAEPHNPDREDTGAAAYHSKYGYSIFGSDPAVMIKQFSQRARSTYPARSVDGFDDRADVGEWVAEQEWEELTDHGKKVLGAWMAEGDD